MNPDAYVAFINLATLITNVPTVFRMAWVIRNNGEKIGHFLDGYRWGHEEYQDERKETGPICSAPVGNRTTCLDFPHSNFNLWFVTPAIYLGQYRSIFQESTRDPLSNRSRVLLVAHKAQESDDDRIRWLLRERELVLKPVASYSKYREFLEDVVNMLDDVLATYEASPFFVKGRLEKAGFHIWDVKCRDVYSCCL